MSQGVFQPVGQKRLTNIAVVRLKRFGKRFEIACYKNKVLNWRSGVEKDLDEVLQTETIFENVSKGVLAKEGDIQKAFSTSDQRQVCLEILAKGDLQISDKEREVEYNTLFRDVASILVDKCVNPLDNLPFTIGVIERALKQIHFSVDPKKAAKLQAMQALPLLQEQFPIQRARMRLKMAVPATAQPDVMDLLKEHDAIIEQSDSDGQQSITTAQVEPSTYKLLLRHVQGLKGRGKVEVISLAVQAEGASSAGLQQVAAPAPRQPPQQPPSEEASSRRHEQHAGTTTRQTDQSSQVAFPCAPIKDMPTDDERLARRKEMFLELDALQDGWTVELVRKGTSGTLDAVFYSPDGERVGTYQAARKLALKASKGEA